ncbi:MAG: PadR family transcriptional regulator [Alphaproteobacteria bacterium]|nr:PadR family transcriptional regulator [Alphaproteobacteria bacterium]
MDTKSICLAVLCQGDTTGYEIKKAFEEGPFSFFQDVSFGSIYPALTRALDEGLVSVTALPQPNRPAKKIYSITPAGRADLTMALAQDTPPDRVTSDFLFKILFSELFSKEELDQIMDRRLAELTTKIERMEAEVADQPSGKKEGFLCGYALAVYRAMHSYIESSRDQLEQTSDDGERVRIPVEAAD